jgi:energy-coupling factor transporter ATP-binding protein EcfA2
MISRVAITNFKSIGDPGVDLELKPLTLLVGPNGGGKSSILEAIAVASQLNLSGKLTSFPSRDSIVHKPNEPPGIIEIYFPLGEPGTRPGISVTYDSNSGPAIDLLLEGPGPLVPVDFSKSFQEDVFLLSSIRGDVPYSVGVGVTPRWVGIHGQELLLALTIIFSQGVLKEVSDNILKWADRFGIGELHAGIREGFESGSDYTDSQLKQVLNLALSSSGARQILTVITQLFWAAEGSLLMIEEPEISLHPQAQIDVLEMFAEAIRQSDKQIIATTHSHILLQSLGYAVNKGWLNPDDITVYHIEKKKHGTSAKKLPLGKQGYIRGWVPSYSKVEKQLLQEWAKTLPRG